MKLSELLAEHPQLDVDLGDDPGRMFLDAAYLFRVIDRDDNPGESTLYTRASNHTDGMVYRGLLISALQISEKHWGEEQRD